MSYLLKHGCHASRGKATMRAVAQDFLALAWKGGRESLVTAYYTFRYFHECDMHILKLDLESKLMAPWYPALPTWHETCSCPGARSCPALGVLERLAPCVDHVDVDDVLLHGLLDLIHGRA